MKRLPKRYAVSYEVKRGHRSLADFDSLSEAVDFAGRHGSKYVLDRKTNATILVSRTNPTRRKSKKFERCVQDVKRSNRAKSGNSLKPYNPWAVCNASVRGLHARSNPVITYELVPHEAREWHDADYRKGIMASVDGIYRLARSPIVIAASGKVLATRTGTGWQFT